MEQSVGLLLAHSLATLRCAQSTQGVKSGTFFGEKSPSPIQQPWADRVFREMKQPNFNKPLKNMHSTDNLAKHGWISRRA